MVDTCCRLDFFCVLLLLLPLLFQWELYMSFSFSTFLFIFFFAFFFLLWCVWMNKSTMVFFCMFYILTSEKVDFFFCLSDVLMRAEFNVKRETLRILFEFLKISCENWWNFEVKIAKIPKDSVLNLQKFKSHNFQSSNFYDVNFHTCSHDPITPQHLFSLSKIPPSFLIHKTTKNAKKSLRKKE